MDVFIFPNASGQINVYWVTSPILSFFFKHFFYEGLKKGFRSHPPRQILNNAGRLGTGGEHTNAHTWLFWPLLLMKVGSLTRRMGSRFSSDDCSVDKLNFDEACALLVAVDDPLTVVITLERNYSPAGGRAVLNIFSPTSSGKLRRVSACRQSMKSLFNVVPPPPPPQNGPERWSMFTVASIAVSGRL